MRQEFRVKVNVLARVRATATAAAAAVVEVAAAAAATAAAAQYCIVREAVTGSALVQAVTLKRVSFI
jgi:hypothetical protein